MTKKLLLSSVCLFFAAGAIAAKNHNSTYWQLRTITAQGKQQQCGLYIVRDAKTKTMFLEGWAPGGHTATITARPAVIVKNSSTAGVEETGAEATLLYLPLSEQNKKEVEKCLQGR